MLFRNRLSGALGRQAGSLIAMHACEVLQPLLVLPWAGRVLGPEQFGRYAYAIAIGQVGATVVGYGFHWTAQRTASSIRHEPGLFATLLADVTAAKLLLFALVLLAGIPAAGTFLSISTPLFMCAMLTAAGEILFPAWLFIGLEQAWQAAVGVIVARSLALVCFLALVTSPGRLGVAVTIQSAIPVVAGAITLPFVGLISLRSLRSMTLLRAITQLRSGWRGFAFTFAERAAITLPVPLVAHFAGYVAAGQFSVAEKFVSATRPFFRVLTETLLPRVAYYAHHEPAAGLRLIWRSLLTLGFGAALSLGLFFVAPSIILLVFGHGYVGATAVVRAMSIIPVLVNANTCLSNLYMFNYGHERAWSRLMLASLLLFVATSWLLSPHLAQPTMGTVTALVSKEGLVFVVSATFFLAFGARSARGTGRLRQPPHPTLCRPTKTVAIADKQGGSHAV